MEKTAMQITAAIVKENSGPFIIDTLNLSEPRSDEVLVRVIASGMCHTDLHGRDGYFDNPFPAIFGHEGGGVVEAIGSAVTEFKPGDHVIMAFPFCGHCPNCQAHMPAHCMDAMKLKGSGTRADGSTLMEKDGEPVYSAFFQQSSFGTYAIANERFTVKVRNDAPLERLGAMACGVQTGAGAVFNAMKPVAGDSLVIFGTGGVGLSALMAAKLAGCDPIIAVDLQDSRLALARELGATHTINHSGRDDVVAAIRQITGHGAKFSIDTSAIPAILREAVEALMPLGTCIVLGSARSGTDVSIEMPFLQDGRTVRGVIQGWSEPKIFLPKLVDLMMEGDFPVERLMTFYPLADINRAAEDATTGKTIKPVLRMPH
jgi:aryl-alcohol dehydrogenase